MRTSSLLVLLLLVWASPGWAQGIAVVSSVVANSTDQQFVTTAPIDSTGANLIVCGLSNYVSSGDDASISDSVSSTSNSWNALTTRNSAVVRARLFYSVPTTVGTGHTFSFGSGGTSYPTLACIAFSGSVASPFDQQNGATTSGATSLATGSVTPSENNEVIVTTVNHNETSDATVDNGVTRIQTSQGTANAFPLSIGYKIQTTAAAINPTWSWSGSVDAATAIATFKGTTPPAAASVRLTLLGVGP